MLKISCSASTDVGKVRDNNEDNFYVNGKFKTSNTIMSERHIDNKIREQYLYAVCDGMGGEDKGELASMIAVESLAEYQSADISQTAADYIKKANNLICDESEKNGGVRMGTTLIFLYIKNGKAVSYNIGDSRAYLFRKNKLSQLSEDHTQAQLLVKMRLLKKDAVSSHKGKHILTQHLGIYPDELIIEPYVSKQITIKQDDIFLLCSDGLTDMVSDDKITEILSLKNAEATDLADKLVETALANGGRDNVTVIAVKITK